MHASTITKTSTSMPDAVDQLLESEAQAAHVVPALRIKGTLVRGRKGDTHEDVMNRIRSEDAALFLDALYEPAETGFGSMAMNRFIDSRDPDTADFDRNELFRRYGVSHSQELAALQRAAEEGKSEAVDSLSEAERITGAAVMAKDGRVFTGRTHVEAYAEAEKAGIGELDLMPDGGFTTSRGRYVSREEASVIATKQRQLGKQVDMTDWPEGKPFELDAAMLEGMDDYYVYDGRRVKEHYIWIGNISRQGRVRAVRSPYCKDSDSFGETPTHGMLKLFSGKRWRYPEGSSAVFWWESPTEDDKAQVDAYMREKGLPKVRHIESADNDEVLGQATADLHFDLAHGHRSPFGKFKLNRAKSKIRSVREEVDRLLDEALDSPYAKRLAFVVRQYGAIRGFMALDAIVSQRPGYYFDQEAKKQNGLTGIQQLRRDMVYLHDTGEDSDDRDALLNAKADAMSDEEFEPILRDAILGPDGWLAKGKWYDGSAIPDRDPSEPIVAWFAREALRVLGKRGKWPNRSERMEIADWFNGARPKPDIFKLTLNQALYRTRRWHAELRRQKEAEDEAESLNTLKWIDLGNGVRMARLGREHLNAEGAAMQNCVGSYKNRSHLNIWSVRRDMKRLYTVEVDVNNRIAQFKAKANRLPSKSTDMDAALRALSWFARAGISVVHEQVHDVSSWWNDEGGANKSEPYVELDPESKKEALRRYWDDVVCYQVMFDLRYLLEDAFINSGGEDLDTALAGMFTDAPAETTA